MPSARVVMLAVALGAAPVVGSAQGRVTIYRDTWGVPHIYADREEDGWYGLGYATGEDQAEYLLRTALVARGEAAAAFGPSQVESDYTSRLWRHREEARAGYARLSPELRADYDAWARGLNQYLADHPAAAPAWAPKLDGIDAVTISRWLLWLAYQAGDGIQKCRASGAKLSAVSNQGLANRQVAASNEWYVAPWRTRDHAAMVLSDPHGGVDGEFVFEFRLHAGRVEAAGYGMGAMPILVHTRTVSWGMTTGAPSVADCYEVALEPGSETRYRYDGAPRDVIRERIAIKVKDAAPVTRTLEYTRHNDVLSPVVARAPGKLWAVSTTYMHRAGDFDEEIYRMVLAKNVGQVKDAMRLLGMFPQNVMAGDKDGGSIYVRAGRTPKRPAGVAWRKALDGNTSRTAWLGIHPLDDLVQIENPESGYMQNNNISPGRMFERSPLTPEKYPEYVYNDRADRTNSRALRIVDVLSRAWQFSVADATELALDEYWIETPRWQEALRKSLESDRPRAKALGDDVKQLAELIVRFDGQARAGSTAALGFWLWRMALIEGAGSEVTSAVRDQGVLGAAIDARASSAAIDALERAAAARKAGRSGCADSTACPTLGDWFRIGRGGTSAYPVGGVALYPGDWKKCDARADANLLCVHTLRAFTAVEPDSAGRRFVAIGSRLLRLVIFTDPLQSFTLHNFGQSSHRDSPHWDDQAQLSSRRELKPVWFEKADLLKHVAGEETLTIPAPPRR